MNEEKLLQRIKELEEKLGIGEHDPSKDGYAVIVKILRQQNEYLNKINIGQMIGSDDAAKKIEYKNAKDLWEGLPKMIESVATLKTVLKIEDKQQQSLYKPISAGNLSEVILD